MDPEKIIELAEKWVEAAERWEATRAARIAGDGDRWDVSSSRYDCASARDRFEIAVRYPDADTFYCYAEDEATARASVAREGKVLLIGIEPGSSAPANCPAWRIVVAR